MNMMRMSAVKSGQEMSPAEVDVLTTVRLRPQIPEGVRVVSESGIRTPEDVATVAAAGVDAVLVGESLVTSKNTARAVRGLVEAGRRQRTG